MIAVTATDAETERKDKFVSVSVKKYAAILIGTGILAFGMYNIHSRCGVSEGGALGLALLLYNWFGISPGRSSIIIDLTAFAVGAIVMKKGFLVDSIIASGSYAIWYFANENIGYVLVDLTNYLPLAALFGGIFVGIGCGLVVRQGCASGGDDSLALAFNKLTGKPVSLFYIFSDFTILLLSLTYIPVKRIGWSLLSVLISSVVIELLRPRRKKEE